MQTSPQAGTVIVIGGALKADSDAVWQRLVDEAGGPGARIAVFPTAAYEPERIAGQIVASLARCGAIAEVIPIAPHLEGVDLQSRLNDASLIARVAACRAVFFSGGAQEYIVDTLLPGGRPTAMLDAIRSVFEAGGVIAGTSAGAAVMSHVMFRDAMDNLAILKGLWREGREHDRGLGFVRSDLFVDQHFLKRGRLGRMLPALQRSGCRLGLGVDENAAVVIQGARLEIIGGAGALLVDAGDATHDPALPAFNLRGVRLSYLEPGDRHDLDSGLTTPAAGKRADPAPPKLWPATEAGRHFLDILGEGCVLAALRQLLEAPEAEVFGLAWRANPAPREPRPDVGFEFRFHRGPAFVAWRDPGSDALTLLDARLDVIPVRVAIPLYTPLLAE